MSIDHTPKTIIGFFPDMDDFLAPLKAHIEEVSHMEERFDTRTGKRLDDVKVVDIEEQEGWRFDGVAYQEEDTETLLEAIGEAVGAQITRVEDCYTGDVFGLAIVPNGVKTHGGRFTFVTVANAALQCTVIAQKLKDFGLDAGLAGVHTSMDVS
jgi:hypothetical protein